MNNNLFTVNPITFYDSSTATPEPNGFDPVTGNYYETFNVFSDIISQNINVRVHDNSQINFVSNNISENSYIPGIRPNTTIPEPSDKPILVWFNGNGFANVGVGLPSYLQDLVQSGIRVYVCDYLTYDMEEFSFLYQSFRNSLSLVSFIKTLENSTPKFAMGGNSAGATTSLHLNNFHSWTIEADALILFTPQHTLSPYLTNRMFQNHCGHEIDFEDPEINDRMVNLFGVNDPFLNDDLLNFEFPMTNVTHVFSSPMTTSSNNGCGNPNEQYITDLNVIFHSRLHVDKINRLATQGGALFSTVGTTNHQNFIDYMLE